MHCVGVLLCLVTVAMAVPQKYSSKFDNVNVDAVLSNDRVVTSYVKCFLDKGPCSPEGKEFKQHLPEALATDCGKCTDAQKNIIRKASLHIIEKRPQDWALIAKKYDPSGARKESFQKFLKSTN